MGYRKNYFGFIRMNVLSVGSLSGLSNTCLHRHWALKQIADHVDEVNTSEKPISLWGRITIHLFFWGLPVQIPENNTENERIRALVRENVYDVVWIDKGNTISPQTLKYIKKQLPNATIISYSPDNMVLRHNQSQQYLECVPLYDYIVTNKSYIIDDLKALGARNVLFVNNTFEPSFHHPYELTQDDHKELGGDVGFVGAWEEERCKSILFLADHGIKVRVFGKGKWKKYVDYSPNLIIELKTLDGEDYCKALQAFKISLCFLRKMNCDQQTTRSVEIPACGGFMLAERTKEHQSLFNEGVEVEFFTTNEELLEKCRYYLKHEDKRAEVARAGRERCIKNDYSNCGMIQCVFSEVL